MTPPPSCAVRQAVKTVLVFLSSTQKVLSQIKTNFRSWDEAHLVESLLSNRESLSLIPRHGINQAWCVHRAREGEVGGGVVEGWEWEWGVSSSRLT